MQDTLRTMISTIVSNAEHVASAADQLLNASEEVADRARQQSDAASSMAASVEEMAVSIDQVKENAGEAHGISQQSAVISEEGAGVIHTAASEMRKISEAVQASSEIVEDLGRQSDQITSIVNTIREIADQTNLLALNAAIEAARAGEQGRGFAVVADEVRKLAERTSLATTEIEQMIVGIQGDTVGAVEAMNAALPEVQQGVELAASASESLREIEEGARRTLGRIGEVADATKEQSTASTSIAQRVEQIANMVEETSDTIRGTATTALQLQDIAVSLKQLISRFRV